MTTDALVKSYIEECERLGEEPKLQQTVKMFEGLCDLSDIQKIRQAARNQLLLSEDWYMVDGKVMSYKLNVL